MTSNSIDYVLGIDLGTTNSCCAIMLNGKLEVIYDVVTQKKIIPSVICYKGKEEKDILIGENAVNNLKQFINSTIFESKRLLGHNFKDKKIEEDIKNSNVEIINDNNKPQYVLKINNNEIKRIYPEEVSKQILKYFKENAKKFIESKTKEKNVKIEKAVITIPHHFNKDRRNLTEKIGKDVFTNVELIEEPTAIGIGYGFIHPCKEGKTFLFFDIGGGSFGISIFRIKEKKYEILALGGGGHLGGENFNKALIDHVKKKISEDSRFKGKIDFTNKDKDPKTLRILFEIKKKVNKVLSQLIKDAKTKFIYEDLIEDQDFILEITQKEYCDELCKDLWEKIFKEIDKVFNENKNIKKKDINEIILVGGSSRTPGIKLKIQGYFGKDMILQDVNVDEIVAQGAAVYANKNIEITDLTKK